MKKLRFTPIWLALLSFLSLARVGYAQSDTPPPESRPIPINSPRIANSILLPLRVDDQPDHGFPRYRQSVIHRRGRQL